MCSAPRALRRLELIHRQIEAEDTSPPWWGDVGTQRASEACRPLRWRSRVRGEEVVPGIQTTILAGDPTRRGLYTIMVTVPANKRIEPHSHRDNRSATVVLGTWYFGYGLHFDDKSLKAFPPGSFYTEPPGEPHFAQTRTEPVIVHITGYGPTDTTYVDKDADPRKP
jgi:uncharacterized RmlC-like cupin family protein